MFSAHSHDIDVYIGSTEHGLPDDQVMDTTQLDSLGAFCGRTVGIEPCPWYVADWMTCENGHLQGRYVHMVTKAAFTMVVNEVFVNITDYWAQQ